MNNSLVSRFATAIVLLATTINLSAQQRTISQAADIAKKALAAEITNSRGNHSSKVSQHLTPINGSILEFSIGLRKTNKKRLKNVPSFAVPDHQPFYVFNDEASQAFVIVAGDERMGEVLGYSATSHFDTTQISDALADLLYFYAQTYSDIREKTHTMRISNQEQNITWVGVPPMLTTKWGQGAPYNAECPIHNGQHSLVGCAATAMAQVMKYHSWPAAGKGYYSYITEDAHLEQSLDFGNITFNWDNMGNYYYNNEDAPDVAVLSHACGVSIAMNYTYYNSWSYCLDIPYALLNYFSYSKDIACYRKEFFTQKAWATAIQNELLNGRPFILRGANKDDNNGHFFVVDGCDGIGRLHINWGWYGNNNGYFKIDGIGLGTDSDDYSYGQWAILKISPFELGEQEDVFFADSYTAEHREDKIYTTFTNVFNYTSNTCRKDPNTTFEGHLGTAIYNASGEFLKMTGRQVSLKSNYGWYDLTLSISDVNFDEGMYIIKPAVMNPKEGKLITPIRTLGGETDSVFVLKKNGIVNVMKELPTAIKSTYAAPTKKTAGTYTLNGQRIVNANRRGLYIKDGKKTIIR